MAWDPSIRILNPIDNGWRRDSQTIIQNDSNLQIANSLSNVAAIQVSGLNIQGTNGSGVTQSMPYKIIRIG